MIRHLVASLAIVVLSGVIAVPSLAASSQGAWTTPSTSTASSQSAWTQSTPPPGDCYAPGVAGPDLVPVAGAGDLQAGGADLVVGDRDLREGWPVNLHAPGAGFPYTPTLYDGDSDGADEIFLRGGETFGLRGDGTFLPGWPTTEHVYMGYGTNGNMPGPSGADVDGDGSGEILWAERDWWAGTSHMWCFNGRNFDGTNLPHFPQFAPDDYSNALANPFVLGDVNGDGYLEGWAPHTLGNNDGYYRISGFDHEGNRLFTTDLDPAERIQCLYYGDLDGNGIEEMFAVSWLSPALNLHVFQPDGSERPGYPVILRNFTTGWLPFGPPVPADLDSDGDLEILFGQWDSNGSRVYCAHHDASPFPGFPIQIATSSQLFYFGLGDVTGDGAPELIVFDNYLAGDYRIFVLDLTTGAILPGWPYNVPFWPEAFPTIVDIDNDAIQDICLVTDGGTLLALNGHGQLIDGYPKFMSAASISGVSAGDIDGDGLFELVAATWDGFVYAWDTTGRVLPGRADWPMRGVDERNTGIFGNSPYASGVSSGETATGLNLNLASNPAISVAEFTISGANPAQSLETPAQSLEVIDSAGRRVAWMPTADRGRFIWRPAGDCAAGVYWARLSGASQPVRLVLVR